MDLISLLIKRIIHLDNMGLTREDKRNLNMLFSLWKNKKLNIYTEFLKDNLEIYSKKQIKVKVLPVKFYYNCVNQD